MWCCVVLAWLLPCAATAFQGEDWLGSPFPIGSSPLLLTVASGPVEDGLRLLDTPESRWQVTASPASEAALETVSLSPEKPWGNLALQVDFERWPGSAPAAVLVITLSRPDSSYQTVAYEGREGPGTVRKAHPLGLGTSGSERWWTAWCLLPAPRFTRRQAPAFDLQLFSSKPVRIRRLALHPVLGDWNDLCRRIGARCCRRVLDRPPTSGELRRATAALAAGDIDPGMLMLRLALSPECIGLVRRGQSAETVLHRLNKAFHGGVLAPRGQTAIAGVWRRKGPDMAIRSLLRLEGLSQLDWLTDSED